jgi:hypothetical protein
MANAQWATGKMLKADGLTLTTEPLGIAPWALGIDTAH